MHSCGYDEKVNNDFVFGSNCVSIINTDGGSDAIYDRYLLVNYCFIRASP